MSAFILVATLVFLFLAIIWTSSNWRNFFCKYAMFLLVGWGTYLLLGPSNLIATVL